jgi:predicted transcriptional regulator
VRTTIRLDDELLANVKRLAAETGRTVTAVIEDALRQALAQRRALRRQKAPELPTFRGRGLRAGVDLDDSAALLDHMERDDSGSR